MIRYGVTPATAPPPHHHLFLISSLSPHTFQIPQRRSDAGRLSAAHSQGGHLLPASGPGTVQSGAELHCQEGRAVERLQWGKTQGKHATMMQQLLFPGQ